MERRINTPRRSNDLTDFSQCQRFNRHELSEEQVLEIAQKAVEIAKNEAARDIGEYVIEVGKGFITRLLFLIGAGILAIFAWTSRHGLHF